MFISMALGAGLGLWSFLGGAIIGRMVYAYKMDRRKMKAAVGMGAIWLLCTVAIVAITAR